MALLYNPLEETYNGLWYILEANSDFVSLVPVGNRIKYGSGDPYKNHVLTADCPEVSIVPVSGSANIPKTSNSSTITKRYNIMMTTASKKLASLSAVEMEIYKAFKAPEAVMKTYLASVVYGLGGGTDPVKQVEINIRSNDTGTNDPRTMNWVGVLSVEVVIWLQNSEL